MSELRLTTGVCRRICNPDVENAELMSLCPVLQILEIRIAPMKPGTKASPKKILQIRMSDSQDWFSGALHENLNNLVEDGTLGKYVVVRIVGWTRVVERG